VILASDGVSLDFLRFRFPDLLCIRMPFYQVKYPKSGRFFRKLMIQAPGILRAIRANRKQLNEIVPRYNITRIISDHRYGLHYPGVHSVFITNQLWLKAPRGLAFGERLVYRIHCKALSEFSEIWIADHAGQPNLSGLLTHPNPLPENAKYIGPVSRFEGLIAERPVFALPFDVLALVSGPEPQRTVFEDLLKQRFHKSGVKAAIFRGLPPLSPSAIPEISQENGITLISHARDEHILWYILEAKEIVCRPGNSTLSDLEYLGKTALLVPTPGQTEQEYVAKHLESQGRFTICTQENL